MITFIVFALACGIVAVIIGLCVLYVRYDGRGGHTGGGHSFPVPKISIKRRLTLHWQLHQDRARNLRARLTAGESWRDAWTCRYAPPWTPLPATPLPVGIVCHEPDTLDGLILKHSATPNLDQGNWTPRQIEAALPDWVIEALGGHSSVDSCIRATFPDQVPV